MHLTATLLALLALAASASALNKIKCYACTSTDDPNCNDPINTDVIKAKECTKDITENIIGGLNIGLKGLSNFLGLEKTPQIDATFSCFKGSYKQTLQNGEEKKTVIRSCAVEGTKICDTLNEMNKDKGYKDIFCETCTTDECNGSSSIQAAAFILVPAIAMLLASY